jgi:hypothetical protein
MEEITNDIQKNRLSWFGHVIRMREERVPRKCYTQKWREIEQGKSSEPDG